MIGEATHCPYVRFAKQSPCRSVPKRNDNVWSNRIEFLSESDKFWLEFVSDILSRLKRRVAINPRSLIPTERGDKVSGRSTIKHIGLVAFRRVDAYFKEHLVKQVAGWANESCSLPFFMLSPCFTKKHYLIHRPSRAV